MEPQEKQPHGTSHRLPDQQLQGPYLRQDAPTAWLNKLCFNPFNECGTFLLGSFCPCVLYGKTQSRLRKIHLGEDPLNEDDLPLCNPHCWTWFGICTFTQHSRVRQTYNIQGSTGQDLAKSCCLEPWALMQADREVRSRAALDKKIVTQGYDSSHQQMRYVPPDPFFGDILDARKSTTPNIPRITVIPPPPENGQEKPSTLQTDGAGPVIEMSQLPSMRPGDSVKSTHTVRKVFKELNVSVSDEKAKFMNECQQRGIVVEDPCKTANKKSGTGKADSDNTIVHKEEYSETQDRGPGVKTYPDETVFVYYNPSTPEPQKLRDCVKTRTSESTSASHAANKRDRSSEHNSEDSCAANEVLSFVEPSIKLMLQIENVAPNAKSSAAAADHDPVTLAPASLTTGSTSESEHADSHARACGASTSSHSTMTISEAAEASARTSEDTVRAKRAAPRAMSGPFEAAFRDGDEAGPQQTITPLHPKTRESTIMPSTPMELEEVLEEIDVDGVWKIPQDGKYGARTVGTGFVRKMRPSFFDGNSEP